MKTLIIKCGAAGDVVRTTPLLRMLPGKIWWVTEFPNDSLLPELAPNLSRILLIGEAQNAIHDQQFDFVLSLDDDLRSATLASNTRRRRLVGAFVEKGRVTYTESSEAWFGMGLLSKRGRSWADDAKRRNTRTYQDILFEMAGGVFRGEEYWISGSARSALRGIVGIEPRAGDRWPTKKWHGYDQLAEKLERDGYKVQIFLHRPTFADYINDIAGCEHVVCGDTLAMHLALALGRTVTAIFTCTPPQEIYDYGRLAKVVSPLVNEVFYQRTYVKEAVESISVETVHSAILQRLAASAKKAARL